MKDKKIYNINPFILAKEANYFLGIHHDLKVEDGLNSVMVINPNSPGHFYVSLLSQTPKTHEFFGVNPAIDEGQTLLENIGGAFTEIIIDESARYNKSIAFQEMNGNKILDTRCIPLTRDQYNTTYRYVCKRMQQNNWYVLGYKDCADFVQDVYHSTGLSLYFTKVFTKSELLELGTSSALKVLGRYGSRDTLQDKFLRIESVSKQALAEELNISEKQIADISWQEKIISFHYGDSQSTIPFTVILNESDLKIFDEAEVQANTLPGVTNNADSVADTLSKLSLSDEQIKQAQQDAGEFFTGTQNNVSNIDMASFIPSPLELFPSPNSADQAWLEGMAAQAEQIIQGLEHNNNIFGRPQSQVPQHNFNEYPFNYSNLVSEQMNIIGNVIGSESEHAGEQCLIS